MTPKLCTFELELILFPCLHFSCTVDGLPLNEFRVLAEKSVPAETRDEKNRKVEFATPTFNVLNALEQMGYKVITSGAFVTGHNKFDQARGKCNCTG